MGTYQYWLPFFPLFNVERETVFTTCIYNNIEYEYKTPYNIDINSQLFTLVFMLHLMLHFSKGFIKISHELMF